jgi:Fur family ferric uptake transcriptional regulator
MTIAGKRTMPPEEAAGPVRMTRQRKVILEELKRSTAHPCAEEVYDRVRRRLPRISLGTVYRNLEKLTELGEITKLTFGGAINRFDPNPEEHYHIRCSLCDRVVDAPMAQLEHIEEHLSRKTEFKIIGHRLEFYGLCPECAAHMISPGLKKLKDSDGQAGCR